MVSADLGVILSMTWCFCARLNVNHGRGTASTDLSPSRPLGSRLALLHDRRYSGKPSQSATERQ